MRDAGCGGQGTAFVFTPYPLHPASFILNDSRFARVFLESASSVVAAVDAADDRDTAGADEFHDAERPHEVDERFDLFFLTGDFDSDFVGGHVDDAAAEDIGELANLGALPRLDADLDQHQVALDV